MVQAEQIAVDLSENAETPSDNVVSPQELKKLLKMTTFKKLLETILKLLNLKKVPTEIMKSKSLTVKCVPVRDFL